MEPDGGAFRGISFSLPERELCIASKSSKKVPFCAVFDLQIVEN
jgi:hypothetical protein